MGRLCAGFVIWLALAAHGECGSQQAPTICIDPGHPSEINSGYTIQNGTNETHIDWVIARKLEKLLSDKGFRVVMTKSGEKQVVRNKERALIANRAHASIMVRLHCDSSTSHGYAIYYPDRAGIVDGVTGPGAEIRTRSREAAVSLQKGMRPTLHGFLRDDGVKGDSQTLIGSKQGALTGSVYSQVPIVTIEMVVLSNRGDAAFIKTGAGQYKMAQALASGIQVFLDGKSTANENPNEKDGSGH